MERANNDLNNLFQSSDSMAVFLDTDLRIKLYTPSMTQLLSLLPGDVSGQDRGDLLSGHQHVRVQRA